MSAAAYIYAHQSQRPDQPASRSEHLPLAPIESPSIERRLADLERRTRYIEERLQIVRREAGEDD